MGGSRERSSGRKDNKKKRRKSRSRSSSKSYEDQPSSFSKNSKRSKTNSSSTGGNQVSSSQQGNYNNYSGSMNINSSGHSLHQANPKMNQMSQSGVMGNFNQSRMISNSSQMVGNIAGANMGNMQNMNFLRPQPPTPMSILMQHGMNMGPMGQFKMPSGPFNVMQRFPNVMQPMRPFSFLPKQNLMSGGAGMMGQQSGEQEELGSSKKMTKYGDKMQQKMKNLDSEPFVTFKSFHLITGIVEVIQNTCISMEKADPELTFFACKKAFLEILKRLKEFNLNRIHDSTEDLLKQMEREFIDEQKIATKEFQNKKALHEKHYAFNNTKFNSGIENIDYQILKLVHKSEKLRDVFNLIQTEGASKVDLSEQSISLAKQLIVHASNSALDPSQKLYQESLKLFSQNQQ